MTTTTQTTSTADRALLRRAHPIRDLIIVRSGLGLITLAIVSVIIFMATQLLPGNAARSVAGRTATPERLAALERQMGLDRPAWEQYWDWVGGLLRGDFGTSLLNGRPVSELVAPQIINTGVLVVVAGLLGTLIGVGLGLVSALRRDRPIDHALTIGALTVTSLPEFVVAIFLTLFFATNVLQLFPAVSVLPPGEYPWDHPGYLILPILTLVVITVPYILRITRAVTIEALESDYVEMAKLKGVPSKNLLLRHALPNAVPATIQAIGLNFLYLAGGIVVVEAVFNYPGLGLGLYAAVQSRDIPTIQFITLFLAGFYIVVNIVSDLLALIASPRRGLPR